MEALQVMSHVAAHVCNTSANYSITSSSDTVHACDTVMLRHACMHANTTTCSRTAYCYSFVKNKEVFFMDDHLQTEHSDGLQAPANLI